MDRLDYIKGVELNIFCLRTTKIYIHILRTVYHIDVCNYTETETVAVPHAYMGCQHVCKFAAYGTNCTCV